MPVETAMWRETGEGAASETPREGFVEAALRRQDLGDRIRLWEESGRISPPLQEPERHKCLSSAARRIAFLGRRIMAGDSTF